MFSPVVDPLPNTTLCAWNHCITLYTESLSATLAPEHWSLHSEPFKERNWPADGIIASFFGNQSRARVDDVGALALQRQVYQSMVGQALWIKSQVETFRATNIFGTLTWQLNDVYPSGSWGSLEVGQHLTADLAVLFNHSSCVVSHTPVGNTWMPPSTLTCQR